MEILQCFSLQHRPGFDETTEEIPALRGHVKQNNAQIAQDCREL